MSVMEWPKDYTIKEVWLDVDGVMSPRVSVTMYEMLSDKGDRVGFCRTDGLLKTILIPVNDDGLPTPHAQEIFDLKEGTQIAEGYRFDKRDGLVIEFLMKAGIRVVFISGRNSPAVRFRAESLGAEHFLGEKDKLSCIKKNTTCSFDNIAFVGDGVQDVETIQAVSFSAAPSDSEPEAIASATMITSSRGGEGVVSEVFKPLLIHLNAWS